MKKERVLKESLWESSGVNGVPQPIGEITRTYAYDPWGLESFGQLNYGTYAEREGDADVKMFFNRKRCG